MEVYASLTRSTAMTTAFASPPDSSRTMADLLDQLGGIPPRRVLLEPAPGDATASELLEVRRRERRVCELVDGVLVEKAMGLRESLLAMALGAWMRDYVVPRDLGIVSGESGMMRLFPGLVRIPDVAFVSWGRVLGGMISKEPIPDLVPDLVVEVLSQSNTALEMKRKIREYFESGVRLVWIIDPKSRTAITHIDPELPRELDESQVLNGGPVLPGFGVALRDLFAELDRAGGR
jgi:Uma2 family endonuclease